MNLGIGSTVYLFDQNRRVYPKGFSGPPIYREHFRPMTIQSETRKSWILSNGVKIPKDGDGETRRTIVGGRTSVFFLSTSAVERDCWIHEHRHNLVRCVSGCSDVETLRKVAALVGYDEAKP